MRYTMIFKITRRPEDDDRSTHIKCEVYYNKGGVNYFTSKTEQRGYYMSVYPVRRENGYEMYVAFTGTKQCIHPVERQSKKQATVAKGKFLTMYKGFLARALPEYEVSDDYDVREEM